MISRVRPPRSGSFAQPVSGPGVLGARISVSTGPLSAGPSTYVVAARKSVVMTRPRASSVIVTRRRVPGRITARPQIE